MAQAPIDLATFGELQRHPATEFAASWSDTFLEEAPAMLDDLRSAAQMRAMRAFRRAAHSLEIQRHHVRRAGASARWRATWSSAG